MKLSNPLYIAEKPNMGAEIAKNLPGPHQRGDGFIKTGGGVVTWAVGHLLEQVSPEEYDEKYKKWNFNDLPIIPTNWKLQVSSGKSKQVSVIKSLLKNCSDVVNAGDPGREGQLIVDEILEYLGNKKPVWRLLLQSLDKPTVQKALQSMQPNSQFKDLYDAALGRQRADWMVGMNLTRAYTILGKQKGYQSVLSVGRVQSPTLGIVVKREDEIKNFIPQNYFLLKCTIDAKPSFIAKYMPPSKYTQEKEERPKWLDELFRVSDETMAKKIIADIPNGTKAKVIEYTNTPTIEQPPLPFELSDVQSKMNAKHGASVQQVLEACQSLYEKGYASYPRTDCVYLPTAQLPEAGNVLNAIAQGHPQLAQLAQNANTSLVSPAWNDAKLGEHHAIIPTGSPPDFNSLSPLEQQVYDAISKRYIAQFYPVCEVDKAYIEIEAGGHNWNARGRVIKKAGWRVVYGQESDEDEDNPKEDEDSTSLPELKVGDIHTISDSKMESKQTKPPSRYTEGTLMQAMKHVDRLVSDPNEKKMLKTVQGIGRAATRANIISTLIKRGYLDVKKKQLHPTATAIMLVNAIDKDLIDPGLTARWEQALDGIAAGKISLSAFQQKQASWVQMLVQKSPNVAMPDASSLPEGSIKVKKYPASKNFNKSSKFNGKSAGKSSGGKSTNKSSKTCPKCNNAMVERAIKNGPKAGNTFLGCSNFPNCKHTEWPK